MADLAPGTLVAGRYRLEHLLGEGGMGAVWAATHEITGGRVALKFLKAAGDPRSEARRRFLREARAATLVDHPNIVQIRDVVDHDDAPVLVMDLLVGETLATRLSRLAPFEVADTARIGLQIVSAVGAAHEAGLIHRDLKPENVFLSRVSGNSELVRVLDFGIAKLVGQEGKGFSTAVTQSGALIGTPAYMAPEQVFGEKELDHRVDVWAIGVLFHEMLTGSRPVEGENYGQIAKKLLSGPVITLAARRPDLPEDLIALIDRMLARERVSRLGDLREALDVLAKYADARRPSFGPPRPPRALTDSGAGLDPLPSSVDPAAPTEDLARREERTPRSGPGGTLVAGTGPRRELESDGTRGRPPSTPRGGENTPAASTPAATTTAPDLGTDRRRKASVAIVVLLVFVGIGGLYLRGSRPAGATASNQPSASMAPAMPTPVPGPVPAFPSVVPSASAETAPSASANPASPSAGSATTKANVEPPNKPVAAIGKAGKPAVSASATPTPTVPQTTPTVAPSPEPTGGLVTKPPF